jgi:hypothetical protein
MLDEDTVAGVDKFENFFIKKTLKMTQQQPSFLGKKAT